MDNSAKNSVNQAKTSKIKALQSDSPFQSAWGGEREVDLQRASFTFVLVDETQEIAKQLATTINKRLNCNQALVFSALQGALLTLREDIQFAVESAFVQSAEFRDQPDRQAKFRVLTMDQERLLTDVTKLTAGKQVLSLSPVIADREGAPLLDMARLFSITGEKQVGFTSRLGVPIYQQLETIGADPRLDSRAIALADDHIVTGSTIRKLAELLRGIGISPAQVVSLTQIGLQGVLPTEPVVRFLAGNEDPLAKMDLVDLVDFVIGAGGCWVRLADGRVGKTPYCLPFASPISRATIPESMAMSFSRDVIEANIRMYASLESSLGSPILLSDVDPAFARYCKVRFGCSGETPILSFMQDRLASLSSSAVALVDKSGPYKTKLAEIDWPARIVLLDVNGTLFAPGAASLDPLLSGELRGLAIRAQREGVAVGLCSDSPLSGLRALAKSLQLRGPLFAELGNIVEVEGESPRILRRLERIAELKELIRSYAVAAGVSELEERWAVEFGGSTQMPQGSWFAFGAGRETSVAIFGDKDFIASLDGKIAEIKIVAQQQIACDINPNAMPYGYAALQPVESIQAAKGEILEQLGQFGSDVTIIGDSIADVVNERSNLRTILVGNSKVSVTSNPGVRRVTSPYLAGALSALNSVVAAPVEKGSDYESK